MHGRELNEKEKLFSGGVLLNRVKLYIYSKSKGYGEKLSRFLSSQTNREFDVELLTEIQDGTEWEKDAYMVTDDEDICGKVKCKIIRLVKMPEAAGKQNIFMYQSGREIYEQLLKMTGTGNGSRKIQPGLSIPKVVCIFDPCESEEKTMYALRTANDRAERGKTLYISLCAFPVIFGEEGGISPECRREGVSELMLCADSAVFEESLEKLAFVAGSIFVLAPAGHFRDLLDFTEEDAHRFMTYLAQQTLFDFVVIETGQLLESTFGLLGGADVVFVPEGPGVSTEARRRLLQEYCTRDGQEELWERFQFVPVPACMPDTWRESKLILFDGEGPE